MTERRSIWDFLAEKAPSPVVLAIIGVPGSGKTTLLRHTALRLCGSRRRRGLPVLLLLREIADQITRDAPVSLPTVIAAQTHGFDKPPPPGWFEHRLRAARCVVMLDGLDEIARQKDRQEVVDWVDRQVTRYPGNDYLITSRPLGYYEYRLERATVLQVRRFTQTQITQFIEEWYLAVERLSAETGKMRVAQENREHIERKASESARRLLNRLRDNLALAELAANPLLLTMIVNVHRIRGELPETRAELYAEMCDVLLGRRQQAKGLADPLRADQKEAVLGELAFMMMRKRTWEFAHDNVIDVIALALARESVSLSPDDFLANIRTNGLLIERERGVYRFAHQTFQEYLSAVYIRQRGELSALTRNVADQRWRETTLLYAARSDVGPLIKACLASGRIPALSLAFECADLVGDELNPELRKRLDTLLSDAANPSASPERRTLAAAVIASRQLGPTFRLPDDTQVCIAPVSWQLYQLFIEQMQVGGRDQAPVGRAKNGSAPSGGVVVGVRGADAVAFVEWLNRLLVEGNIVYRLPTRAEIEDPVVSGNPALKDLCIWLRLGTSPGDLDLWSAPDTPNPYAVSSDELSERVQADAEGPIAVRVSCALTLAAAYTLAYARAEARDLYQRLDRGVDTDFATRIEHDVARARRLARDLLFACGPAQDQALIQARTLARDVVDDLVGLLDQALTSVRRYGDLTTSLYDAITSRYGGNASSERLVSPPGYRASTTRSPWTDPKPLPATVPALILIT